MVTSAVQPMSPGITCFGGGTNTSGRDAWDLQASALNWHATTVWSLKKLTGWHGSHDCMLCDMCQLGITKQRQCQSH